MENEIEILNNEGEWLTPVSYLKQKFKDKIYSITEKEICCSDITITLKEDDEKIKDELFEAEKELTKKFKRNFCFRVKIL